MNLRRFRLDRSALWSLASGLALALAFPRPDLGSVAWFALVPLLLVMAERPFRNGFLAGLGFFAVVLYWLNIVMVTFGKLNLFFSVVAVLLIKEYLVLYFGTATLDACRSM